METSIIFTLRYLVEGSEVIEKFASPVAAMGRTGALVANGIGCAFAIYMGTRLLMDQSSIFDSLRIRQH
jgi:hypothetical protein